MAAGYLLLPPLHRLIERDYLRMDLLFFPAAALLAYAVTVRRDRLALAAAALMLCVREAGALAVLGLGLHWLCVERRVRSGLALVALGVLWLPLVNYVWLPWILGHPAQHVDHVRSPAMVAEQLAGLGGEGWPLGVVAAIVLLLLRRRWAALLAVPSVVALPFYRMALRYSAPLFSVMWMTIADEIAHWSRPRLRRRRRHRDPLHLRGGQRGARHVAPALGGTHSGRSPAARPGTARRQCLRRVPRARPALHARAALPVQPPTLLPGWRMCLLGRRVFPAESERARLVFRRTPATRGAGPGLP